MQTKLTLRLDQRLIEQAKHYSASSGKSVSQLVADYFVLLTGDGGRGGRAAAPVTQSLKGVLRHGRLDEADYRRHLEEKHL